LFDVSQLKQLVELFVQVKQLLVQFWQIFEESEKVPLGQDDIQVFWKK
jgi:hypothetical protein